MYKIIHYTHYIVVTLFLVIYFIKTILLLSNKEESLKKVSKALKVPEMIVSVLFLATGIYLFTQLPEIKMLMIIKISLVLLSIPLAIIGFKKRNKILASLSFFMLVSSFGIAEVHHKRMGAMPEESKIVAGDFDGGKFYNDPANCIRCHGIDGKLGASGASDLSVTGLSKDAISSIVQNGRGLMEGYKNLTPEQANAIASYVETLRGK